MRKGRATTAIAFSAIAAVITSLCVRILLADWADEATVVILRNNVRVTSGWESRPLIEPHLIAHPSDPRHLLGAMIVSTPAGDSAGEQCATIVSLNGGVTWTQTPLNITECGDPWLSFAPDGSAVLTVLGRTAAIGNSGPHLLVYSSTDGGRTWNSSPQDLGPGYDHETAISGSRGDMYILSSKGSRDPAGHIRFAIHIARRTSSETQFAVVQRFVPSNLNVNTEGLAVLSDGALVASYIDIQRPRTANGAPRDGLLEHPRTWALRLDGATSSFGVPLLISESCSSGSYMAADLTSGRYHDRLYHVCIDQDGTGVFVQYSSDGGERWSAARQIDATPGARHSRSHPQLVVNKDGALGVTWLDSREDATGRCYDLYFSASLDGAATFLAPTRISTKKSCPDATRNGSAFARWPRGGDYTGLAATSDGLFHALWPDASSGVFQMSTTTVAVSVKQQ